MLLSSQLHYLNSLWTDFANISGRSEGSDNKSVLSQVGTGWTEMVQSFPGSPEGTWVLRG